MSRMKTTRTTSARLLILAALTLPAACTTQQAYLTGQGWQQQQCLKLPDLEERRRCEKSTAMSYERYREEADAARRASGPR
jgi:hypothetical protein